MNNTKLQEFVTNAAVRSQITFGDVRRLQRDYLPGGVSTCEEAELLMHLDGKVGRADRAWTDWLVTAILGFAASNEQSIVGFGGDINERLKGLLASAGTSTKATRKIAREIRRDAGRSWPQAKKDSTLGQAASSGAVQDAMNALQLAA